MAVMGETVKFCIDSRTFSEDQREAFMRHAGVARKAWNWALGEHNKFVVRQKELVKASGDDLSDAKERKKSYEDARVAALLENPAYLYQVSMQGTGVRFTEMTVKAILGDDWFFWQNEDHGVSRSTVNSSLQDLQKSINKFFKTPKTFTPKRPRKDGMPDGWPRFKSAKRDNPAFSLTYTTVPHKIIVGKHRLRLPGTLGVVRVYDDTRKLKKLFKRGGTTKNKTIRISEQGGRWYLSVRVDLPETPEAVATHRMRENGAVGVDQGIIKRLALSDGSFVDNPRYGRANARRVRKYDKALARRRKMGLTDSRGYARMKRKRKRAHHIASKAREGYNHRVSKTLMTDWSTVVIEDLKVNNMMKAGGSHKKGLNKSLADASFGDLRLKMEYKAVRYGSHLATVPAPYTSQRCSSCGHTAKESRETQARFHCVKCGHTANADTNASMNILFAYDGGRTETA